MKGIRQIILEKDYNSERIIDISENIIYAINEKKLPLDEYGFFKGTISIKVTYSDYEGDE